MSMSTTVIKLIWHCNGGVVRWVGSTMRLSVTGFNCDVSVIESYVNRVLLLRCYVECLCKSRKFTTQLSTAQEQGVWQDEGLNRAAAAVACEHLNEMFHRKLTVENVMGRIMVLRSRWRVFHEMTCCSGVCWDKKKNQVHATPEVWHKWAMEYPDSAAYIYQGDPLHDELSELFGRNGAGNQPQNEHDAANDAELPAPIEPLPPVAANDAANVIIISDDEDGPAILPNNVAAAGDVVIISSDDEAVPILNFHDDAYESIEFESSEEDEVHVESPSLNVEEPGEVLDQVEATTVDSSSSTYYQSVIPRWSPSTHRGMFNRYNVDYRSDDDTASSDDSSSSTRTLNSRRY